MISITHTGDLKKTYKFLNAITGGQCYKHILDKYGKEGVRALSDATPVDTGLSASSWYYEVTIDNNSATITWNNSNEIDGIPIVVLLQYGHATKNGGYVKARDFINPAMKQIFDEIADSAWKEVTKA